MTTQYIYDLTDTWNAAGTVFTAIKMDVTDTASAAGSKLIDLQIGGSTFFNVDKSGQVALLAGTAAAPTLIPTGDTNTGMWFPAADTIAFSEGGVETMRITSNGNVGIGTNSPNTKLEAVGDIRATSTVSSTYATIASGNADGANLGLYRGGSASQAAFFAQYQGSLFIKNLDSGATIFTNTTSDTERMRITSAGNVGIGISNPRTPLDVNGTVSIRSDANALCFDILGRSSDNVSYARFLNSNGTSELARILYSNDLYIYNTTNYPLVFGTNNTERLRITATGNVGIGTSSPGATLDVAGFIRETSNFPDFRMVTVNNRAWRIGSTSTGTTLGYFYIQGSTDNFVSSLVDGLAISDSGNVGIGTTSPSSKLDIVAQDAIRATGFQPFLTLRDSSDSNKGSRIQTASGITIFYNDATGGGTYTERMRIDDVGRIIVGGSSSLSAKTGSITVVANSDAVSTAPFGDFQGNGQFIIGGATNTNKRIAIGVDTASATMIGVIQSIEAAVAARNLAINPSGGNVGIGTSSPTTLLSVNGIASFGAGTAALPSVAAFGDLNTGMWFPAADTIAISTGGSERLRIDSSGNVVINTAAIATTATDGFLYVPSCAGTPTGTPTTFTGRVPIVVDTTNNKLYFYSGGQWRDAGP